MRNYNKLYSTYEDQEAIGTVLNADNSNTFASNKSKQFNKKFLFENKKAPVDILAFQVIA